MNERIKELAVEAGYKDFDYAIIAHKFAELIVKECISNLHLHGYDDAMNQIKEHFGVKE